jgi:hypothetical protein
MNEAERKVLESRFEAEMTEGYLDGRNPDNPPPSSNRSASYKHGFENGRDDHAYSPRATAALLRIMAVAANPAGHRNGRRQTDKGDVSWIDRLMARLISKDSYRERRYRT